MGAAAMIAGHPDRETVTLLRAPVPEQNERGVYEAATAVSSTISLVIHELDGWRIDQLPAADRGEQMLEVYSTQELRINTPAGDADRITRDGKTYRVTRVDEQRAGGVWLAYAALESP